MARTKYTGTRTYEELTRHWRGSYPFHGAAPYPAKVTAETVAFLAWGPDSEGLHRTPNYIYFSTKAISSGIFSLAPGDYFGADHHPNPETYVIKSGTLWVTNPETGQYSQLEPGDVYLIPALAFHGGYNFGDKTVSMYFMIPRQPHTEEMRTNPNYEDVYANVRKPIVLHPEVDHHHQRHPSWAQAGRWPSEAPESRLDDLLCWPPRDGKSVHHDFDVDHTQIVGRKEWLHFATGRDYEHQFLTSFAYSTNEYQTGKIRIPPGRVTNAIRVKGDRVYYPLTENPLVIILSETEQTLVGKEGDGLFVPANVIHQFENVGDTGVEALFMACTEEGVTFY